MDHIAIDLGGRESQICIRDAAGAVLEEERIGTRSLGRYLKQRAPSRVIVETCAEAFSVADEVEMPVTPPVVTVGATGAAGVANDSTDPEFVPTLFDAQTRK